MKAIKKINNNVAVCLDSKGREVVAFGKGIGFPTMPYEIDDLNKINHTFYNMDESYFDLIHEIDMEIIDISAKILEHACTMMNCNLESSALLGLADHINFAIDREKKNVKIRFPFIEDINQFYPEEMKIAKRSLKYINSYYDIHLDDDEAIGIAMHLINVTKNSNVDEIQNVNEKQIIDDITNIVSFHFQMDIDRNSINYARFASHVVYMLKRKNYAIVVDSDNKKLYTITSQTYPKIKDCVEKIAEYFFKTLQWQLNEEEKLYLMLHMNRLTIRESNK